MAISVEEYLLQKLIDIQNEKIPEQSIPITPVKKEELKNESIISRH